MPKYKFYITNTRVYGIWTEATADTEEDAADKAIRAAFEMDGWEFLESVEYEVTETEEVQ
jgi:hypothetical protein